jgi:transcriptional regulator with XRE-family HTH domain
MEDAMSFGAKLRALRKKRGWPITRFAAALGVSATYVREIETDIKPPPSGNRIRQACDLLGGDPKVMLELAGRPFLRQMPRGEPEVAEVVTEIIRRYESGELTNPMARELRHAIESQKAVASCRPTETTFDGQEPS